MKIASSGIAVAVVLVLAATMVAGALAGKPIPYQGVAGATQGAVQSGGTASAATPATTGTLPFTGVDLGIFALGGVVLVAAGYSLTRRDKKRASQ